MLEISELTMMDDTETGAALLDKETGELNMCPIMNTWCAQTQDAETGEFGQEIFTPHLDQKRIFQVPRSALHDSRRSTRCSRSRKQPHVIVVSAKHKVESTPEKTDPLGKQLYNSCFPILILLMFLPAWMASLYVLMEWILHRIAHRTDKIGCFRLYNPLCYFTSTRCAICQSQRTADKIIQIQDRRKLRVINKKLEYLNYVNTMIS